MGTCAAVGPDHASPFRPAHTLIHSHATQGVTFAVANAVVAEEKPGEAGTDAAGADKRLCTFALRIKNPDVLAGFLLALQTHKQEQAEVKEGGEA